MSSPVRFRAPHTLDESDSDADPFEARFEI